MAEIKFENVSKSFGKTTVIENMNLTLPDGKFTVLLGPSGCGKTTLLRMIAGIGPESSGTVYMNGKETLQWFFKVMLFIRQCLFVKILNFV